GAGVRVVEEEPGIQRVGEVDDEAHRPLLDLELRADGREPAVPGPPPGLGSVGLGEDEARVHLEDLHDRGEHRLSLGVTPGSTLSTPRVLDQVHGRPVALDDEGIFGNVAVADPPGGEATPRRPAAEVPSVLEEPVCERRGHAPGSAYPPAMPPRTPKTTAAPWVPNHGGLADLQQASKDCRGCDLWRNATQSVVGEGPAHPYVVFAAEQPGDKEALAGHPFVGPAARVLDEALAAVGIDRRRTYVTNAVKHFKYERGTGQRRIHAKPNQLEIQACRPWLEAELSVLQPRVLVCLGSPAAQALLGRTFRA